MPRTIYQYAVLDTDFAALAGCAVVASAIFAVAGLCIGVALAIVPNGIILLYAGVALGGLGVLVLRAFFRAIRTIRKSSSPITIK